MLQLFLFCFLFLYPLPAYSFQNSSSQLCHHHDKIALLQFINSFTIDPSYSFRCVHFGGSPYPKTKYWKENKDCCLWDGVTCDTTSGHVIELDLSCSRLRGVVHPNNTLFQLTHLQTLNLAYNDFNSSLISPNIAHFASLKVLNLSSSNFMGDVPINFGLLFHLVSLDLSHNYNVKMPNIDKIMRNLTSLRELALVDVSISSTVFLQTLVNLSSLTLLELDYCKLQGSFPSNIFSLPHLKVLTVGENENLYVNASLFNNLSSSLQFIDFSSSNLTGRLPKYSSLGSHPPQLSYFSVARCNLYGAIPMWIWNTTEVIVIEYNRLSGKLPSYVNTKELSNLTELSLSNNLLTGPIPSWLMNLPSLETLYINDNQFVGEIPEPYPKGNCLLRCAHLGNNNLILQPNFLAKCSDLTSVDLSCTSLIGGATTIPTFSWPYLSELLVSSCNITSFPNFLSSLKALDKLDLSNNKIQGEIPTWFYNVGKDSLYILNISHNNITGGLNILSWNSLKRIDLRTNSLQGLLPLPPPATTVFLASNNKFHGEINSSFCDLKELKYLDLSNNHLNGTIPKCFGKLIRGLELLDLGSNLFHGVIHMTFVEGCSLESMHLNNNNFEGKLPRSLMRCKQLKVLDLRSNRFNDSFPHWLATLPELKVLLLQSNNFRGSIKVDSKAYNKNPFPKLQILDLSNNQFYGELPLRFFKMFKALMMDNGGIHNKGTQYISEFLYYQDSVVLTMKGSSVTYYKILTILAVLDLSNNSFSGEIPNSIGGLVALVALNVSHNQLTGPIPPSLANLTTLISLDLSYNMLKGKIPPQLIQLIFLEVFNVSENKLEGSIPQGNQFNTFSNDSYGGNSGLCGDPLPKCGENGSVVDHKSTTLEFEQEGNGLIDKISLLEIILLGFGLGAVLGSSIGYCMLLGGKPNWFLRNADRLEGVMVQRLKKRSRRQ